MEIIWDSKRNWTIVFLMLVIGLMIYAQHASGGLQDNDLFTMPVNIDLEEIQERDTLRAIIGNNSMSYFIYKGVPMGYEYELLSAFAEHLGVHLSLVIAENSETYLRMLNRGKGDVLANSLTITQERHQKMTFTEPLNIVQQVLVQRKPDNWWTYTRDRWDEALIRNPIELIGKEVDVPRNSAYDMRLQNLSEEIGGQILIRRHDGTRSDEQLIQMVSNGEIDYTIADNNVAQINATYFKNLDIETEVSFPQRTAWAVRKNSPELLAALNEWLREVKRTGYYQTIYAKYFKNSKAFFIRQESLFSSINGGAISVYDDLIRKYADEIGWDWRLLAAQIYKESKFDNNAVSWAGARGLMQIVPSTAGRFGDSTRMYEPEHNLMVGTRYIKWLDQFWDDIPDPNQRLKFVIASYNVGEGHVLDAQRLARKFGKSDKVWDNNVDSFLVRKSYPEYYRDEVVNYGYCRGSEPFKYVREVLSIYNHYLTLLPA